MKRRPAVSPKNGSPVVGSVAEPGPTLPAWKAFVVQFSREAGEGGEIFAGRVEHLSSGRRARFDSPAELLGILERLLDELGKTSR